MPQQKKIQWMRLCIVALLCGLVYVGLGDAFNGNGSSPTTLSISQSQNKEPIAPLVVKQFRQNMVRISAGSFQMGSTSVAITGAQPVHPVRVNAFWLDKTPVTNQQFMAFVAATGYVTTAEQVGRAKAFNHKEKAWNMVPGANWRNPEGPSSSIVGKEDLPVVQVSWSDAAAYARWAGKRLPTEAEYEHAARAGIADASFSWGNDERPDGKSMANYWQGRFPHSDHGTDGFHYIAPVGSFPVNAFELHDMTGNVWCWCQDWYAEVYYLRSPLANPLGPESGTTRVLRGGSWLSAKSYRFGIHPAFRWSEEPEFSSNHIGFRCAADE